MIDEGDILRPLLSAVHAVARVLLWLAWDLMFTIVGWTVGWLFLRATTFGNMPQCRYEEEDEVDWTVSLTIEIVGLLVLACTVAALSVYLR